MRTHRAGLAAAMTSMMILAGSHADTAAQVYVVHGIPGQDVGAPAALPVDVCLAGGVPVGNLTGVTLGQHEALTRRAGEHRISAVTGSLLHPASQFTASRNADTARFAYAVGSRENRTLALVVEAIPVP
jgi:hypothetical protein